MNVGVSCRLYTASGTVGGGTVQRKTSDALLTPGPLVLEIGHNLISWVICVLCYPHSSKTASLITNLLLLWALIPKKSTLGMDSAPGRYTVYVM